MSRPVFEPGDTIQFTFAASTAPNSGPTFKVLDATATVIASITSVQSDTTHYYALYTVPTTEGPYVGEWFAQKTFSGSAYNFIKRFAFNVQKVRAQ